MDFSVSSIMAGFVFGTFGLYFMRLGKKDANIRQAVIGMLMLVYPYFVENPWLNWGIGVVLFYFAYRS